MRTIIDASGCNTTRGATGLTVSGELIVNDKNIVQELEEMKKMAGKCDENCAGCSSKLTELKNLLAELKTELKDAKEKIKTLEQELKKAPSVKSAKKDQQPE